MELNRFGIIGLGAVGNCLAQVIQENPRMSLTGYMRPVHKDFSEVLPRAIRCLNYEEILSDCDILFLTVPDDHIGSIVDAIAGSGVALAGKVFCHCSGVRSSQVLKALVDRGGYGFSIHPLMAFTGDDSDLEKIQKAYVTIEAHPDNPRGPLETDKDLPKGFEVFVSGFEDRVQWVASDCKALYHGAAVMVSNYMVTLVEEGFDYLRKAGFEDTVIKEMLLPLVEGTLANIKAKGTVAGLTGPVLRGDTGTIKAHLKAIETHMGQESSLLYRQLGKKTADMIQGQRIDDETYKGLIEVMKASG